MTIKKFRKNDWSDEEVVQKPRKNTKRFDRALRTRDIDYLSQEDDD